MACAHQRLVLHRRGVDQHDWPERDEALCGCRPALVCPTCDAQVMRDEVCLLASPEIVDELRADETNLVMRRALN